MMTTWDRNIHQFIYLGMRQTRRLIAYAGKTNSWRDVAYVPEHGVKFSLASKVWLYKHNAGAAQ